MADLITNILLIILVGVLMFHSSNQGNTTMNNTNFARLISTITVLTGKPMTAFNVEDIQQLVKECQNPNDAAMTTAQIRNEVDNLFRAYKNNAKIEAIKAYRTLTGYGLKESKDAVEGLIIHVHNNYKPDGYSK